MQSFCGTDCCSKCSRLAECGGCKNVKGTLLEEIVLLPNVLSKRGKRDFCVLRSV